MRSMHTHKHNASVEELYGETLSRHCESEIRNTKIHKISLLSSYNFFNNDNSISIFVMLERTFFTALVVIPSSNSTRIFSYPLKSLRFHNLVSTSRRQGYVFSFLKFQPFFHSCSRNLDKVSYFLRFGYLFFSN